MVTNGTGLESLCEKPACAGLTDYQLTLPTAAPGVGPAPRIASPPPGGFGRGHVPDSRADDVHAEKHLSVLSRPRGSVVPTAIKACFCQSVEQLRLGGLQRAVLLSEKVPLLQSVSRP